MNSSIICYALRVKTLYQGEKMKETLRWIDIWIAMNSMMLVLSMSYFYLNNQLLHYASFTLVVYLFVITLPYLLWKYKQKKLLAKHSIVIQILKD